MKLILDEWIVRDVIDTLYMARTTLLGITGLDSPQEVANKSANETAITRRISKAIDIIQQSEQSSLPEELEEAAEKYRRESYSKSILPNIDGPMPEYVGSVKDAFIAGAEWQKQHDAELIEIAYNDGITIGMTKQKEQMMKGAVEGEVMDFRFVREVNYSSAKIEFTKIPELKVGDRVKVIIVKED